MVMVVTVVIVVMVVMVRKDRTGLDFPSNLCRAIGTAFAILAMFVIIPTRPWSSAVTYSENSSRISDSTPPT